MKRFISISAFMLLITATVKGQTASILIQNPSFEQLIERTHSFPCGMSTYNEIPGWNPGSYGSGTIIWTCAPAMPAPDGLAIGWLGNTTISQDLGIQPQAGVYTLTFFVANWFNSYPGSYEVTLTMGGKELCGTYGWAMGDFKQVTLTCPVAYFIASGYGLGFTYGGTLGISVTNTAPPYWYLLVDDFSLIFTPEQ